MTQSEQQAIRHMEEISLNAWPSHKMELYDGWILRFSRNYTYRTNAVEQIGASLLPIEEKVSYCEEIYRGYGTPCHFKINPLTDPSFDRFLAERDYEIRHVTQVMTADLDKVRLLRCTLAEYDFENRLGIPSCMHFRPEGHETVSVLLRPDVTEEWLKGLFHLNGTSDPALRRIVPSMYYAIPKKTIVACVEQNGQMVASGLGICDRDYIGIYAIYVLPGCRRRQYASSILSSLLEQGKLQGARRAYLQVVKGNLHAKSLYAAFGFSDYYTYWFRSKTSLLPPLT